MNNNGNAESNFRLLIGIVIAIVVGTLVGGFAPGIAVYTEVLGDIFLTLLKMVVVPLVIFSMVVGITNLGDIRNLGSIGGRTVLYYMATTAISVIIGMILVNIIAPGKGIELSKEGDQYPQLSYTLGGENNLTVTLPEGEIEKDYSNKFIITLVDQNLVGEIESIEGNEVTVENWQDLSVKLIT